MPLHKTARSRSQDPRQEALREHKHEWNIACSAFLTQLNAFKPQLIAFKHGLNGRSVPKAGIPISNIKDPLPNEMRSYLGRTSSSFHELVSTFESLVAGAGAIMQEQAQYSNTRRKPVIRPNQPRRAEFDSDDLVVEGSTPVSRLWAHISSLLSSDKAKHQRLSMLSMSIKLFRNMVDFEDMVLSKGLDNVPQVLNAYFLVHNNFQALKESSKRLSELVGAPVPESATNQGEQSAKPSSNKPKDTPAKPAKLQGASPKPTENEPAKLPPSPLAPEEIERVLSDPSKMTPVHLKENVARLGKAGLSEKDAREFFLLYHRYNDEKDADKKDLAKDMLYERYTDLIEALKASASVSEHEMEKFASNFLTRLLKKYRHQFGLKEPSSAVRMEIYTYVRDTKIIINKIMDLLETRNMDGSDLAKLNVDIVKLDGLFDKIGNSLKLLDILHKDKYYDKNAPIKNRPMFDPISRYYTRQVRRDVDKSGG